MRQQAPEICLAKILVAELPANRLLFCIMGPGHQAEDHQILTTRFSPPKQAK